MVRFPFKNQTGPSLTFGTSSGIFGRHSPLLIAGKDLHRHYHVIGESGSGKSSFLETQVLAFINQGIGVSVIDPHGDLAVSIIQRLCEQGYFNRPDAYQRVYYVDFSYPGKVPPMNVLHNPRLTPDEIAESLVQVCRRIWPNLQGVGVTFENIIRHATMALAEVGLPLTDMTPFLTKADFQRAVLTQVTDEVVRDFFTDRYNAWKDVAEKRESTLNRLALFTTSKRMRAILGSTKNLFNYRQLMDDGVSVIYNFGGIRNRDQKQFLGAFITYGYEVAAQSREDIEPKERRLHIFVQDEFQLFSAQTGPDLEDILSGARKYNMFLYLAHQNFGQVDDRLKSALQNAVTVSFELNYDDASWMAPRLTRYKGNEVKHEVHDKTVQERTHPLLWSISETVKRKSDQLEDLPTGHAFIKLGSTIKLFKTAPPLPFAVTRSDLAPIFRRYADELLIDIPRTGEETQRPLPYDDEPPVVFERKVLRQPKPQNTRS